MKTLKPNSDEYWGWSCRPEAPKHIILEIKIVLKEVLKNAYPTCGNLSAWGSGQNSTDIELLKRLGIYNDKTKGLIKSLVAYSLEEYEYFILQIRSLTRYTNIKPDDVMIYINACINSIRKIRLERI